MRCGHVSTSPNVYSPDAQRPVNAHRFSERGTDRAGPSQRSVRRMEEHACGRVEQPCGRVLMGRPDRSGNRLFLTTMRQLENTSQHLPTLNARAHLALCALVEGQLEEARHHTDAALNIAESSGLTSRFQVRAAYLARATSTCSVTTSTPPTEPSRRDWLPLTSSTSLHQPPPSSSVKPRQPCPAVASEPPATRSQRPRLLPPDGRRRSS